MKVVKKSVVVVELFSHVRVQLSMVRVLSPEDYDTDEMRDKERKE